MAAEQGIANAQYALGLMYENDQGVPKDFVQAYAWSNLAAITLSGLATSLRDEVAEEMTPNQIAEAQELSRVWFDQIERGEPISEVESP